MKRKSKTTLLEAIAARCGIQPGGGDSYAETEDDRDATALSDAVDVTIAPRWRPHGLFLRADRFAETMAHAGRLPMPLTGEWRLAAEQSRGEGVLSLLSARVDASERMLFLLDEPKTGLSPQRKIILLALLDELHRDGRSQAIVATHSPILLSRRRPSRPRPSGQRGTPQTDPSGSGCCRTCTLRRCRSGGLPAEAADLRRSRGGRRRVGG